MVASYLDEEGLGQAAEAVRAEVGLEMDRRAAARALAVARERDILTGDWAAVDATVRAVVTGPTERRQGPLGGPPLNQMNVQAFLYALARQRYLERIDAGDTAGALALLRTSLKPQESAAPSPEDFRDLCYLLSCRAVTEGPGTRRWKGVADGRERLAAQFRNLLELDVDLSPAPAQGGEDPVGTSFESMERAEGRLIQLLEQAAELQIVRCKNRLPSVIPRLDSLLDDFKSFAPPNSLRYTVRGHRGNVKCATFVGDDGTFIASGGGDSCVRVWRAESGVPAAILRGHTSRIWDISASRRGDLLTSAGSDSTVRVWNLRPLHEWESTQRAEPMHGDGASLDEGGEEAHGVEQLLALQGFEGDVYSSGMHPDGGYVASGGYDRLVRLWDLQTGQMVRSFSGHNLSVSHVRWGGSLLLSASKDYRVRIWDMVSGACVRTLQALGEVTSVNVSSCKGHYVLTSSKDNANRLWDMRTGKVVKKFKGHQNTSKNFVSCTFGPSDRTVIGGSEDGLVYLWDLETGHVLDRLGHVPLDADATAAVLNRGHMGIVYSAAWNERRGLLCSASEDRTVKVWQYRPPPGDGQDTH